MTTTQTVPDTGLTDEDYEDAAPFVAEGGGRGIDIVRAEQAVERLETDAEVCGGPILAGVIREEIEAGELSGPALHIVDDVLTEEPAAPAEETAETAPVPAVDEEA